MLIADLKIVLNNIDSVRNDFQITYKNKQKGGNGPTPLDIIDKGKVIKENIV